MIITNFISKKVKEESKIKDINLKNEKSLKENATKDNIIRKCKNLLLSYIRKFINVKIKKIYNNDIGEGIWRKEKKILIHNKNPIIKLILLKNY